MNKTATSFHDQTSFRAVVILIPFLGLMAFTTACGPTGSASGFSRSPAAIDTTTAEAQAVINIMNTNCLSCHGAGGAGGVSNINDLNAVYAQSLIVLGSPDESLLLQEIEGGTMPPGGSSLSASDMTTIRNWIQSL